jgi:hypothetical protein
MSEKELNHEERLALSMKARIQQLVFLVQDDDDNICFKPGCAWWLATLGTSANTNFPQAVHFCDQIGVSQDDFKKALGQKYASQTARQTTILAVSTAIISRRRMGRSHTPWVNDIGTSLSSGFATYKALHGSLRKNRRVNSPPLWETSHQKLRQELLLQRTLHLQEPH